MGDQHSAFSIQYVLHSARRTVDERGFEEAGYDDVAVSKEQGPQQDVVLLFESVGHRLVVASSSYMYQGAPGRSQHAYHGGYILFERRLVPNWALLQQIVLFFKPFNS